MGRATWIVSDISTDREFRRLNRDQQRMYYELLANAFGNLAGYFSVDVEFEAMVAHCTQEEVIGWLSTDTPLWKYDLQTQQVLLPTYLKYNKVRSSKQLQGVASEVSKLKVCKLHVDFLEAFEKYSGVGSVGFIDRSILRAVLGLIEQGELTPKDAEVRKIIRAYI